MKNTLNITPSPRVLRMLGQIDFAPWQCLAELVDNSIDAFLGHAGEQAAIFEPRITISLPSDQQVQDGSGIIAVRDNGPGMDLEQLENAVKAGYSGNDPVEKMGLFGMGFNISTARLGRRTEVWTTKSDSPDWVGVVIDFDELESNKTFEAPIVHREKTQDELEDNIHGTEVRLSKLEASRTRPLIWGAGKASTKRHLGKVYGRVMSNVGVTIIFDGDQIKPLQHCVWNASRTVPTAEFGNVPARIEIDEDLPPRKFCNTCWFWLEQTETECPACGLDKNVIERKRRLKGWIGVQRYFDKNHYGFDLIRNGRVIESLDKSLFDYQDAQGDKQLDYPVDTTHWGGRFVGELEIDFVRVTHQKDAFDKLDPEWKQVVQLIRGSSPLRPQIAKRMGLSTNTSHLARLFAGFRSGSHTGLKALVPGDSQGKGMNAGLIREWVEKFHAGEEEFQSDEKWYELVLQAERANRGETASNDDVGGELPIDNDNEGDENSDHDNDEPSNEQESDVSNGEESSQQIEPDTLLSRIYVLPFDSADITLTAKVRKVSPLGNGRPYTVAASGYTFGFDYDPSSELFEESLQQPLDLFLTDLANHFLAVAAESPRDRPISSINHELRVKYFPDTLTDIETSSNEANALFKEIRESLYVSLPSKAPIDSGVLDEHTAEQLRRRALEAEQADDTMVEEIIKSGEFAKYVDDSFLIKIIERFPDLVMDGKLFSLPYYEISESLRQPSLLMLIGGLEDTRWLAEDSGGGGKDTAWRLRYSRALASMRLLKSWQS